MTDTHILLIDIFFLLILLSVISGIYILSSTTLFIRDGNDNDNIVNMPFSITKFVSITWIMTIFLALIYTFIHNPFLDSDIVNFEFSIIYILLINAISIIWVNIRKKQNKNINNPSYSSGFIHDITCTEKGFCFAKIQYILVNLWIYILFIFLVFSSKNIPNISTIEVLAILTSTLIYILLSSEDLLKKAVKFLRIKRRNTVKEKLYQISKKRDFF